MLRLQESRRRYASVTILAETRTTFRYVAGEPTLSASRLRRPSLAASRLAHPRANVRATVISNVMKRASKLSRFMLGESHAQR